MKTSVYALSGLIVTFCMTAFYGELKSHFNRPDQYLAVIDNLKHQVETERIKHLQTSYQLHEFRQHVATLMPDKIIEHKKSIEKSYPFRSLASVVQKQPSERLVNYKARMTFEEGARFHREKKYDNAVHTFENIIKYQPYSAKLPETMFLLVDSYYNLKRYEEALQVYDKMLDVYPELDVTGYAMLLASQIYKIHNKPDKAVDLCKTVLQSFTNPDLVRMAHYALRQAEL